MTQQLLIEKLASEHRLSEEEYRYLLEHQTEEGAKALAGAADQVRKQIYGNKVYIRGLIELSNYCKNDCLYCGIRKSNRSCERYRLSAEEILSCCKNGYRLGFRTFVLQGGEDAFFTDAFLCDLLRHIKQTYPDCAVTLSLGERSEKSYQALFDAGADRYLLRHETAEASHYSRLHPPQQTFSDRMHCLKTLKAIGYQVGSGFMVGSPYQTTAELAKDLMLIQEFQPDMCGIGPFIPQKDTPFAVFPAGSVTQTCYLLSILRLMIPNLLLPATTALGTLQSDGREQGILSGANVIMPNLSPNAVRKKYIIYDGKHSDRAETAEGLEILKQKISAIGYCIVTDRGDKIAI